MIWILRFSVALLATVLVFGMGAYAWRQRSFGVAYLALWMTTLAACGWALAFMIGPDGRLTEFGLLFSAPLTMLAGPLLLGYVTYAVRGERLHWAWFLPFGIHLALTFAIGFELYLWFGMIRVVLLEFVYTAIAWLVFVRGARPLSSQPAVIGVLAAVTTLHAGQVAGILDVLGLFEFRPIRQAPLVIVLAWLVAALVMAVLDSPQFRRLAPGMAPLASDSDRDLFARIERQMREGRPWSDPDLDVGTIARQLGTYPNAVSRSLARAGDTTFYQYVNRYRIQEAQRLLSSPEESRTKVEALGRQAGFRARSTFFKLFRASTGLTPSEYRIARNGRLEA